MYWYFSANFILILLHAGQGLSENRPNAQVRRVKSVNGMDRGMDVCSTVVDQMGRIFDAGHSSTSTGGG